MPRGSSVAGTLNISVTTLVDDVGLCQVDLGEVFKLVALRIAQGVPGGYIDVNIEGREEPVQRVYWDYEDPNGEPKKLLGVASHLLQ